MPTELVSKSRVIIIHLSVNHYKVSFIYVEKWALAYRHFEHRDTDTNMLVERYYTCLSIGTSLNLLNVYNLDTNSFHNKHKTNPRYLNHNINRRCDDLIEVLMSVEEDLFYERRRKEVLTSITEATRKVEGDRHSRGQSIVDSKVHTQVILHSIHVQVHIQLYIHVLKLCCRRKEIST